MKNIFVITKNEKITYEIYLTKLIKFIRNIDEVKVQSQIGMQTIAHSIIEDVLGVGGWIKEYDDKKIKINKKNKENKKYQLEIYEFCIRRDVHNQIKNV